MFFIQHGTKASLSPLAKQHHDDAKNNPSPTDSKEASSVTEGAPDCFGNHSDTDTKCIACPLEAECILA
jgi:hypothetical protein